VAQQAFIKLSNMPASTIRRNTLLHMCMHNSDAKINSRVYVLHRHMHMLLHIHVHIFL